MDSDKQGTIRVYARNWDGSIATAAYFKDYLCVSNKWNLEDCNDNPDLVIAWTCAHHYDAEFRTVFKQRMRWGFRNFFIGISAEGTKQQIPGVDYSLSFKPNSSNNLYFSMLTSPKLVEQFLANKLPAEMLGRRQHPKKYFCNFIYGHAGGRRFTNAKLRQGFALQLSKYKQVDCAGKLLNNTDRLRLLEDKIGRNPQAKHQFMRDYKFSIAFENQVMPGYITEKIWDAYLGGTVPIYRGSPDIAKYFNPASFIFAKDLIYS